MTPVAEARPVRTRRAPREKRLIREGGPTAVVGAQFGDEGKGAVTDRFAEDADLVVRNGGGANAGHTVVIRNPRTGEHEKFKLNLMPSGALHDKEVALGAGVVIDPEVLIREIKMVRKVNPNLKITIDPRAHVVLPQHKWRDTASESKAGKAKIGTTARGIGPCNADKAHRRGIRMEDLIDPRVFGDKLRANLGYHRDVLHKVYGVRRLPESERVIHARSPPTSATCPKPSSTR